MTSQPSTLIADIGGTYARFALADGRGGFGAEQVFRCADYPGLAAAVGAYLDAAGRARPGAAVLAVAAPVEGNRVIVSQHPWLSSGDDPGIDLGIDDVRILNDFDAVARGVPHLGAADLRSIGAAAAPQAKAPIGIIGPGTGLGVAGLVWAGDHYVSVPGEGGHVTAAAYTQREFDVLETLHEKYRHISAERVCSGRGLVNLYDALRQMEGRDDLPPRTPEEVAAAAQSGSCALSAEALDMMLRFLGMTAGNLALTLGAFGGIYLAGGICSQLDPVLLDTRFRAAFEAKGRLDVYLKKIPTYLILHPYVALLGLAHEAAKTR